MNKATELIEQLFKQHNAAPIISINKLPQSGSERQYYRLATEEKNYIATFGENVKENAAFIYFSKHFQTKKIKHAHHILCKR